MVIFTILHLPIGSVFGREAAYNLVGEITVFSDKSVFNFDFQLAAELK